MQYIALLSALVLLVVGPTSSYASGGNLEKGKQYFSVCQSCHGKNAEGNPERGAPRLAGQHDWYLIRQLQNFRADIRGAHEKDTYGGSMNPMAKMLPDEQALKDVVAYITTLKAEPSQRTEKTGIPAKGKEIFAICQSCHGKEGRGNHVPGAPRLAGQHDWYLIRQLKNFKADIRGAHKNDKYGQSMRSMAFMALPDEQAIKDVVAYIKTLE
ncbi:MAG: c-type cytochrome [Gammaproteobacteria bacterium]|nr:MAG: c-type cytochrome [Gammaproteobacteria bacterium]